VYLSINQSLENNGILIYLLFHLCSYAIDLFYDAFNEVSCLCIAWRQFILRDVKNSAAFGLETRIRS